MKTESKAVKLFLKAISNRNRLSILKELLDGELCAGDLMNRLEVEQTLLSHDLKCLVNCRFITFRKDGRKRIYRINEEISQSIRNMLEYIEKYSDYFVRCNVLKEES